MDYAFFFQTVILIVGSSLLFLQVLLVIHFPCDGGDYKYDRNLSVSQVNGKEENMAVDIDITELLEDYAKKSNLSMEIKLMLEAKKEIAKAIRVSKKFADDNNNSRLRFQDVIHNCMELYEKTCFKKSVQRIGKKKSSGCRWRFRSYESNQPGI